MLTVTSFVLHLVWQIGLPPLLGMLVAGVLLRNISYDPLMGLPDKWASAIRVCSLSIIFVRSGLELDWKEFKKVCLPLQSPS